MKVLIAGGGTAGHVNPALALAEALGSDEAIFMGTDKGVEASLVPAAGFRLERIEVRGFDRSRPWSLARTGVKALGAIWAARRWMKRNRPDVVVGMGGYVSLPACIAGWSLRIPVVLHEQNVVLGLAHRVSKPLARRVAVSYRETLEQTGRKGILTGNPVLRAIGELDQAAARARGHGSFELDPARSTLLIFGGSQGAQTINAAAAGLAGLWRDQGDRQIVHITGRAAYPEVSRETDQRSASASALIYRTRPFVEDMGSAYAVADLALCRGGATTLAELGAVGLPAIIVPYPHHRDRQQEKQARSMQAAGAAVVVPDDEATAERISDEASKLLSRPEDLARMSEAARSFGRPRAAAELAEVVRSVAA